MAFSFWWATFTSCYLCCVSLARAAIIIRLATSSIAEITLRYDNQNTAPQRLSMRCNRKARRGSHQLSSEQILRYPVRRPCPSISLDYLLQSPTISSATVPSPVFYPLFSVFVPLFIRLPFFPSLFQAVQSSFSSDRVSAAYEALPRECEWEISAEEGIERDKKQQRGRKTR